MLDFITLELKYICNDCFRQLHKTGISMLEVNIPPTIPYRLVDFTAIFAVIL